MSSTEEINNIIQDLLNSPKEFDDSGKANLLLDLLIDSGAITVLEPLCYHQNTYVRRTAAYIASELGAGACGIIRHVAALSHDRDPHTQWYALESLAVCAHGPNADLLAKLALELSNTDGSIRRLAMRLLARVNESDLRRLGHQPDEKEFQIAPIISDAIQTILNGNPQEILAVLTDPEGAPLLQASAAIAAQRLKEQWPKQLRDVLLSHSSRDVRIFATEAIQFEQL